MILVSKHFHRSEFACKCGCGFAAADIELVGVLEDVRERFKLPVAITSGCRCQERNAKVGGAKDSQHTKGLAADIEVAHVEPKVVADYLEETYPDKYGIGRYAGWTHIDVREKRARWTTA
jgi:uncharacterized protein YcbK (DUF882 family)